jgi:hypothetical protein
VGGACGTHGRYKKCIQKCCRKAWRVGSIWEIFHPEETRVEGINSIHIAQTAQLTSCCEHGNENWSP